METPESLKEMVKEKYSFIALQSKEMNQSSCCGSGVCSTSTYNIFNEDYSKLSGYQESADLGLGCGLPTEFADLKKGQVVVDLGSGAGNDAFVARSFVGESGKVIGIVMTEAMIEKARENNENLNYNNVEFRLGEIEKLPVATKKADVVISNCVLNLVPSKENAFSEIYRILKNKGHFCISDIVLNGELPTKFRTVAEMYAGCITGAISKESYLEIIEKLGFKNVSIRKERQITIPDDILKEYFSEEEIQEYKNSNSKIYSITVTGEKLETESFCNPTVGCC